MPATNTPALGGFITAAYATQEQSSTSAELSAQLSSADLPVLEDYLLGDELGRGGMGVVYRAHDISLNREVAIKILLDDYSLESSAALRFFEEAQITSQLGHPSIPAVYRVGQRHGRPFMAMKLVKGHTLEQMLKTGEAMNVLAIFEAIAQAVGFAHAHGVIHRDLKPHNIMVGAFGEVQVMDWGLAKLLARAEPEPVGEGPLSRIHTKRESHNSSHTQAGSVMGTLAYMAPEQAAGAIDQVKERSDVFGLGAILCQMLTGAPPYCGESVDTLRRNAVRGTMDEALAKLDAGGHEPEITALCKACLSYEPADRPADGGEVAKRVAAIRAEAAERARQAEVDTARVTVQAAEQGKRRTMQLRATGVLLAGLLIGGAVAGSQWMKANELRHRAEENAFLAQAAAEALRSEKRQAQNSEADVQAYADFYSKHFLKAVRAEFILNGPGTTIKLREVLKRAEASLGGSYNARPRIEAMIRFELALSWWKLEQPEQAVANLERAVALCREHLGPENPLTLQTTASLGGVYSDCGRNDLAVPLLEEACGAYATLPQRSPVEAARATGWLAEAYAKTARWDDAARVLRGYPPTDDSAEAACRQALLGEVLVHQARWSEAEPVLVKMIAMLDRLPGPLMYEARNVRREATLDLIRIYEATGLADKLLEWAAKLPKEMGPSPKRR